MRRLKDYTTEIQSEDTDSVLQAARQIRAFMSPKDFYRFRAACAANDRGKPESVVIGRLLREYADKCGIKD